MPRDSYKLWYDYEWKLVKGIKKSIVSKVIEITL